MNSNENRTQYLYKTLSNSGNVVEQFEKIIENCTKMNIKYEDQEFYPQKSIPKEDEDILGEHVWNRIEDQYQSNLFENISPESIMQGCLGDCYFVVALLYASHSTDLVKYLFHPKSSLQYGCVLIYFWYLGYRIPVIIDTQIPYRPRSSHPLFCHPRKNEDSCWFVLVEKAFAKACGGYWLITKGQSNFALHVLFDYYSTSFSKIEDMDPPISVDGDEEKRHYTNVNEQIFQNLVQLKEKNAMIGTSINREEVEDFNEDLGLISDHAYYILEAVEYKNEYFLKIRNPWGDGKYNGLDEKVKEFKEEMNYKSDEEDGSFWMHLDAFLYYFNDSCYSLPKEKGWKEESVFGKIDGYLDGRTPCKDSPNAGCLPQWSIKFTQKTVVRITSVVSGPESFHGIFLVKNHGEKVHTLKVDDVSKSKSTNSFVEGFQYRIDDFDEPYTLLFDRSEKKDKPCYFRILIQSPDTDFSIEKFNDNYIIEKWNSAADTGFFDSDENDQYDPYSSRSLAPCKQWFINFPDLMKNDQTELRFRIFKDKSDEPLHLFFARTDKRIRYSYSTLPHTHFKVHSVSNYEEYTIQINDKNLASKDEDLNNFFNYVFAFYRSESNGPNKFKFIALSKRKFELGLMPGPDPSNHCGYTIQGEFQPGRNDGATPFHSNTVKSMKQWCLIFQNSPVTLYVDLLVENSLSDHYVYLEMQNTAGQKIDRFYKGTVKYTFDVEKQCPHDLTSWEITDTSKPYALCITRDKASEASEFVCNIFGTDKFEMYEIDEDEQLGRKASFYDNTKINRNKIEEIDFDEVEFFQQPINFSPKNSIDFDDVDVINDIDDNDDSNFEYYVSDKDEYEEFEAKSLIISAKTYLKNRGINYNYISLISNFDKTNNKKYVFVISDLKIIILKNRKIMKTIKKKFKGWLTDILSISLIDENTIQMQFKIEKKQTTKQISFNHENPNLLLKALMYQVKFFLATIELNKILFDNIQTNNLQSKCSTYSILHRFVSSLTVKEKHFSEKKIKKISLNLLSNSNSINLSRTKKLNRFVSTLFPCISMNRKINQIDILHPKEILPLLNENYELFDNIYYVKIKDDDSKNLQEFIEKSKNINSVGFHDKQIRNFNFISELIENEKINSIGFDSSLNKNSFESFVKSPSFNKLNYFRVSKLENIDLSLIIESFEQLSVLSLTSCNLHIGEFIESFLPILKRKLKKLDLSGNIGDGFSINKKGLSNKLTKRLRWLFVNDVVWEVDQLIHFLNICSNSKLSTFSISNIQFKSNTDDQWNSLFSNLPSQINSISTLNWNSNEIDDKFISLLLNSKNLENVSFCDCICSDPIMIQTLLMNSNKIKKVNLKNIQLNDISQFDTFLSNINEMKSLRQIDLSHNKFNAECFAKLSQSLINSTVDFIALDDSNFESFNDFKSFMNSIKDERIQPISVSYPVCDILRFKLNNQEISQLNECISSLRKPFVERTNKSNSRFPNVYFMNLDIEFPQYNSMNSIYKNQIDDEYDEETESDIDVDVKKIFNDDVIVTDDDDDDKSNKKTDPITDDNKNKNKKIKNINDDKNQNKKGIDIMFDDDEDDDDKNNKKTDPITDDSKNKNKKINNTKDDNKNKKVNNTKNDNKNKKNKKTNVTSDDDDKNKKVDKKSDDKNKKKKNSKINITNSNKKNKKKQRISIKKDKNNESNKNININININFNSDDDKKNKKIKLSNDNDNDDDDDDDDDYDDDKSENNSNASDDYNDDADDENDANTSDDEKDNSKADTNSIDSDKDNNKIDTDISDNEKDKDNNKIYTDVIDTDTDKDKKGTNNTDGDKDDDEQNSSDNDDFLNTADTFTTGDDNDAKKKNHKSINSDDSTSESSNNIVRKKHPSKVVLKKNQVRFYRISKKLIKFSDSESDSDEQANKTKTDDIENKITHHSDSTDTEHGEQQPINSPTNDDQDPNETEDNDNKLDDGTKDKSKEINEKNKIQPSNTFNGIRFNNKTTNFNKTLPKHIYKLDNSETYGYSTSEDDNQKTDKNSKINNNSKSTEFQNKINPNETDDKRNKEEKKQQKINTSPNEIKRKIYLSNSSDTEYEYSYDNEKDEKDKQNKIKTPPNTDKKDTNHIQSPKKIEDNSKNKENPNNRLNTSIKGINVKNRTHPSNTFNGIRFSNNNSINRSNNFSRTNRNIKNPKYETNEFEYCSTSDDENTKRNVSPHPYYKGFNSPKHYQTNTINNNRSNRNNNNKHIPLEDSDYYDDDDFNSQNFSDENKSSNHSKLLSRRFNRYYQQEKLKAKTRAVLDTRIYLSDSSESSSSNRRKHHRKHKRNNTFDFDDDNDNYGSKTLKFDLNKNISWNKNLKYDDVD